MNESALLDDAICPVCGHISYDLMCDNCGARTQRYWNYVEAHESRRTRPRGRPKRARREVGKGASRQ